MNLKPLIIVAAGAGVAYALSNMKKGAAVANLGFSIGKVKIGIIGITPVLDITVKIGNTSNQTFNVNALYGQVYVNNIAAGSVESYTPTVIQPIAQTDYPLRLRLGIAGIAKQIVDIVQGKSAVAADIRFIGTANVDTLVFPIDINYRIL